MRKWIIAAVALLSLCAIVVIALLNLNALINRNKDYLLAQAQQALGRRISAGEVSVSFWGGLGLSVKDFAMSDDPSFSAGDFVRANDLQVNVELLPLLQREFQIKRLILHEPVIEIVRNKKGDYNFSTIGKTAQEKERQKSAQDKPGTTPEPAPLLVALVAISGGELHYVDHKDGSEFRAKRVDFQITDLDLRRPLTAQLKAALFSEKQNFNLRARIGPLASGGTFNDVALDGTADIEVDFGKLKAALPAVSAGLPKDAELSGIVKVKDLKFSGTPNKLALKGSVEATEAALSLGRALRKAAGVPLVLAIAAEYSPGSLRLGETKLKLHNLELAGKGVLRLGDASAVNLALDSNRFSLDGWEKIIPLIENYQLSGRLEVHATLRGDIAKGAAPEVRGTALLSGAAAKPPEFSKPITDLNARINFSGQKAVLEDTTLTLANARIRLAATVERFAPLALSYQLSSPEIRPADFQASLPEERKADVLKNVASDGTLRAADGGFVYQGKLASALGTLYRINYADLAASLSLENKVATIRELRLKALGGALQANGEYAFNSPAPHFTLVSKLQGIDIKELYSSLSPNAGRDIRGRLNADVKVFGSGDSWDVLRPNLRGEGQAEVLQGALLNFNIAEGALSGITGIPGLASLIKPELRNKYPETFQSKDTNFKEMKALFHLADGRINVKELRIAAADFSAHGNGWADFDRRVDFQSVLSFSQALSADLGRSAREVAYAFNSQNQLEIPFALKGTLPNVKARPDTAYLGKLVQRGFLRRGTEELQKRFFGTAPSSPAEEPAPPDQRGKKKRGSTEEQIRKGLEGLFKR